MIVAKGTFQGRGGHVMRGTFVIEERSDGFWMVTDDDFYFDGSPEPAFALSSSSTPTASEARDTRFHNLPASGSLSGPQIEVEGRQEARIGEALDLDVTKFVFLWCFLTPFLLGVGPLERTDGS